VLNDNLEKQAKILYDYWFTQFDFPDENGRPYCSSGGRMIWNEEVQREIPYSFQPLSLSKLFTLQSGYAFSSDCYSSDGEFKLITIKNVQDSGINLDVDHYIKIIPNNMPDFCKLKQKDILMSLTGNVGRVGLMFGNNCLLNQRVAVVQIGDSELHPYIYFLLKSDILRKKLETIASGSSQSNLSPIEAGDIIIPYNNQLARNFAFQVKAIINNIVLNMTENQHLITLRDWLLPMLMNGQATIEV